MKPFKYAIINLEKLSVEDKKRLATYPSGTFKIGKDAISFLQETYEAGGTSSGAYLKEWIEFLNK